MSEIDRMWAPWRMEMIRTPKTTTEGTGCFLCDKPAQSEEHDRENLVLERGRKCFCLMNLYPYNNCHLMVVPYRHTGNPLELSAEELSEIMEMTQRWVAVIKRSVNPDGFNIGMNVGRSAGAGMAAHLHMHIVPRWNGDTNFMSVTGNARVINQALEETWAELKKMREELDAELSDPEKLAAL